MNNWTVSSANEAYLDEIKSTHAVEQLPAYDIYGNLIAPVDYKEKIAGSIAHVCFSIVHFNINKNMFSMPTSKISPSFDHPLPSLQRL